MASNRPGGEPTEQATPKRLREARDRGQVARSQELTAALGFAAAAGVLLGAGSLVWAQLRAATYEGLSGAVNTGDPTSAMWPVLREAIDTIATASIPIVVAAAGLAAVAGYLQVGGLFTVKPITPDLERINPLEGAKRLFSKKTWVELLRSVAKIGIVGFLAYDLLWDHMPELARLPRATAAQSFMWTASLAGSLLFRVVLCYALIGAADLLWQRHVTKKELMMTREEVKREHKEQAGDPLHKAERRRLHRDLLRHQMVEAVRAADAVIVNPDHIAVAIRYDEPTMRAPRVVATGWRLVAQQIKEVARQYGVPIYRDVPLARSLADLELDSHIPEDLYDAVAAVLRFVYAERGEQESA